MKNHESLSQFKIRFIPVVSGEIIYWKLVTGNWLTLPNFFLTKNFSNQKHFGPKNFDRKFLLDPKKTKKSLPKFFLARYIFLTQKFFLPKKNFDPKIFLTQKNF